MKIFYPLLCYYPSESGGPANTIYWLNKALGRRGVKSLVLSTEYGLKNNNIDSELLYNNFGINTVFISGSIVSFFSKKQIQNIKESEVIHFSSLFFKPTLFYLLLGLLWGKKIIISPRGELYEAALARKSMKKNAYLNILKTVMKRIVFHSTNPIETELIRKKFPNAKNIIEIPNFIELPKRIEIKTKNQLLFLGRINPIKNIHLLIEAYYKLPASVKSSFTLSIAGEAILDYEKAYLKELQVLINEQDLNAQVKFSGGIYGDHKEQILAKSFCTILPSKSENFGNVVLESLSQGTPVIVTKNAPWELVEEYNAGYWVAPTVSNLTNAINKITSLKTVEYNLKRESAFNLAKNKFDISKNIDCWIDFYEN